jgi:hypothetical protein
MAKENGGEIPAPRRPPPHDLGVDPRGCRCGMCG